MDYLTIFTTSLIILVNINSFNCQLMAHQKRAKFDPSNNITALDYIASMTIGEDKSARSRIDCSVKCSEAIFCLMFDYKWATKMCRLFRHNGNSNPASPATYDNTVAHYLHTYNRKYKA